MDDNQHQEEAKFEDKEIDYSNNKKQTDFSAGKSKTLRNDGLNRNNSGANIKQKIEKSPQVSPKNNFTFDEDDDDQNSEKIDRISELNY